MYICMQGNCWEKITQNSTNQATPTQTTWKILKTVVPLVGADQELDLPLFLLIHVQLIAHQDPRSLSARLLTSHTCADL